MRRRLALCLAMCVVLLLVGIMAGAQAPMQITWLMRLKPTGEDTTWFIEEINKQFNVKIVPNGIATGDSDKINVMLAAGEQPDAMFMWTDPKVLYSQGVIRGIPIAAIRANMPNYTKMLDRNYPVGWLMNLNPDNKNEQLATTSLVYYSDTILQGFVEFRIDQARKVGFDLPDYDKKKVALDNIGRTYFLDTTVNLDWLEKLLIAFRDKDPDGNGKNDTIPWSTCVDRIYSWCPIYGAFGVSIGIQAQIYPWNRMVGGELLSWEIDPGYRDFLKLIARWYAEGLVDKEFPNLTTQKSWTKIAAGQVGAGVHNVTYTTDSGTSTSPPDVRVSLDEVKAKKGAEVVVIPPPMGPTGIQGARAGNPIGPLGYDRATISSKASDEKMAKILQIIDWMRCGSIETWINSYYGKPMVHFTWAGDPWQSKPVARDIKDVPAGYPKQGDFGTGYPYWYTKDNLVFVFPQKLGSFITSYLIEGPGQKMTLRPYRWDFFNNTKISEIQQKKGATLQTIVDEYFLKAVTGAIDIDGTWNDYVKNWRTNGGNDILAELQKSPLVSELRKGVAQY